MPRFHPEAKFAEKAEAEFRVFAVSKMPAQIEQGIHLTAGCRARFCEQFIDYFDRTSKATSSRLT